MGAEDGDADFHLEPRFDTVRRTILDSEDLQATDLRSFIDKELGRDEDDETSLPLADDTSPKWTVPPDSCRFGGGGQTVEAGIHSNSAFVGPLNSVFRGSAQSEIDNIICKNINEDDKNDGLVFRFWIMGAWWHVVVDKKVVTTADDDVSSPETSVASAAASTDLWPCYLEKAFAKYLGSYKLLQQPLWNYPHRVMLALTGGVPLRTVASEELVEILGMRACAGRV
eukprot:GHVS01048134.1.p1 GENE.GHVS01048134.1~~GHVS01048134.1.p1  ORF type:complete len:226 (-),score=39.54 GHVS01048134.1:611-1288(-)